MAGENEDGGWTVGFGCHDRRSARGILPARISGFLRWRSTAPPEVAHRGAVSGFLYFPYQGKASGLKSIDLLFQDAVMKLK
jgi:hypothetical protein